MKHMGWSWAQLEETPTAVVERVLEFLAVESEVAASE